MVTSHPSLQNGAAHAIQKNTAVIRFSSRVFPVYRVALCTRLAL